LQDRDSLIDHVILVSLEMLAPPLLDQLDHPSRIEVHAEADAAAHLRQVLDRQAETTRAGRPEHQPVRSPRKELVGQRLAEDLVVGAKVIQVDACFRDARGSTRLEHVDRLSREPLRNPALHGPAAQRLVLELPEAREIREGRDLATWIPAGLLRELEPMRT